MLGKDTEKKNERHHLSVMALIFSSSSRRCGNVCKRSKGRRCGKQCLRAVGKLTAFPSGRKYLFSIGGAAVFHISIVLFWDIGSPSGLYTGVFWQELMSMIIRKGEFSFFCTVSSIKESGIFSADSTAFSNKLQNKEVKSRGYICCTVPLLMSEEK